MTEKDKAALNKALEALERLNYSAYGIDIRDADAVYADVAIIRATLAPAVVEPVASGETANTERKNASDYWARHNAPEPEKAQGDDPVGYIDANQLERWRVLRGTEYETAERCYMPWSKEPLKTDISDCCVPVYLKPLTERREPPADLSLDAIKKDAVIWYDKNFNKGVTMPTDREVMYRYIDYLASQGRISGVSKEGEE